MIAEIAVNKSKRREKPDVPLRFKVSVERLEETARRPYIIPAINHNVDHASTPRASKT
jgi:hypothetical protein